MQAVFNEMEDEVPSAIAGDNVRVRIRGVEEDDVSVGFVLCEARKPVHSVTQFQAQLAILESKNIICAGYSAVMHIHTMSEEVTLTVCLTGLFVISECMLTRQVNAGSAPLLRQKDWQEVSQATAVCQEGPKGGRTH